jgi:hypothetical protein
MHVRAGIHPTRASGYALAMSKEPRPDDPAVLEETTARRTPMIGFYKVEKWTRDETKVDRRLYAGQQSCKGAGDLCTVHKAPTTDPANNPAAEACSAAFSRNRFPYAAPAAVVCLRGATSSAGHRK